ncbi:MAG: LUD domain-containing protein [Phycisphaerales bacterium]|nr:LUD domain-containing protein [Phycisphaerales bacterium]
MAGISEQEFFATIREALSRRGPAVDLPDDLEVARVVDPKADLPALMAANAEQMLLKVYRVADEPALVAKVMELLAGIGAKKVMLPAEDIPGRETILAALQEKGIVVGDPDKSDEHFTADAGITGVESAIAETPSLFLSSGGHRRRLASLAPPVHIAVLRVEQIVPDLLDWGAAHAGEMPASETLVSGPSKTGDIELIMVLGVHGPKEEHIIILG